MAKVFGLLISVLLLQLFWTSSSEGARILVLFTPAAPSHFFLGNSLVKELINKGHDVTFVSSYGSKIQKKNIKDIVLTGFSEKMEEFKKTALDIQKQSFIFQIANFIKSTEWMAEESFNNTGVLNLLKSNEKFDLVIMEMFLSESQAGFAHHFDCPLIAVSTIGSNIWVNGLVGNQAPPSYVPQIVAGQSGNLNFWQRTKSLFITYTMEILHNMIHLPQQDAILHKYMPGAPPLNDIIKERVAIVLLNSHPSISPAKPSVPNMIEIGGFHLSEPKPLPKDLKDYLDNAKQGFILFSMGSNLKSTMLPLEKREMLMKVFAKLPYQILWKFEDDNMPGKPDNVRIDKWLPQNDILTHPNLKLFITHGGLLSTTEAIYHGIPVVGVPVIGDQKINMDNAEALGFGKSVPFEELSYEKLLQAVQEVLNNEAYREAARHRSALFRDQPMRLIDTAMYWIEYVLRHGYSDHLKTGAIHLSWYQIQSLDVLAFLGLIVFSVVSLLYFAVKKCCCRSNKKSKQDKKKNA